MNTFTITTVLTSCLRALMLMLVIGSASNLTACGGGGSDNNGEQPPSDASDLDNTVPYLSTSPYASAMKSCVLASSANSCALTALPLLIETSAVETGNSPSIDAIMERVLVSHSWMGLHFRQVLETLPPEVLQLFGAVTTIVIDDDIRPSYYQPNTSTIFIDAAYLWLTNAEKAVVTQKSDYRSNYADALAFVSLGRSVYGSDYAWEYYALDDNEERALVDIRLNLARLLLHELMHANDYFPPRLSPYLAQDQSIYQAYQLLQDERISTQLVASQPLQSQLLKDLADVMFQGEVASSAQRQITPLQVGEAMESDGASDDYGYATPREDVAMLFSEAMMKYLFDVDSDIAYSNHPADGAPCSAYIVEWGMRGRIGDSAVKARAQFVVAETYPDQDLSLFFQNLAPPLMMRAGDSWCDNLVLF